jgi:5'-methylthioadenosine phosphorylase
MSLLKTPAIGVIGGSGLYQIEGLENQEWITMETPYGDPSDQYLKGELDGCTVVFLPRHGRKHRIMPSEINHKANLCGFRKLGVRWIMAVSAVGSLQEAYQPRDILFPDQFIDRTKKSQEHTYFGGGIVAHIAFADPICVELSRMMHESAVELGLPAHLGGAYVNMEGPAFSTRAESITNHKAGYDVIGMTNLGEAKCAREAEIAYANMAMITDYDAWKVDEAHVTVEMVIENLQHNAENAKNIIRRTLPKIPVEQRLPCHEALKTAVLTPRKDWDADILRRLDWLLPTE